MYVQLNMIKTYINLILIVQTRGVLMNLTSNTLSYYSKYGVKTSRLCKTANDLYLNSEKDHHFYNMHFTY